MLPPAMFTKPFDLVVAEDLDDLVGWPENFTLEFKRDLPSRENRGDAWVRGGKVEQYAKEKLLKEVVAFANSSGGHLVIGIDESDEAPHVASGINGIPRCNELAEDLYRIAQQIDPPSRHCSLKAFQLPVDRES